MLLQKNVSIVIYVARKNLEGGFGFWGGLPFILGMFLCIIRLS